MYGRNAVGLTAASLLEEEVASMRRVKLIFAAVAAMTLMMLAASPPALANHKPDVWEWFPWGDWDCYIRWEQRHDESWRVDWFGCWHPAHGW
jgi:hypothetical protein